jgi:phage shock protein B
MSGVFGFVLLILLLVVVLPLWLVLHYVTRWRGQKTLTAGDERMLADLWQTARRLDDRIAALERAVLDEPPTRKPNP